MKPLYGGFFMIFNSKSGLSHMRNLLLICLLSCNISCLAQTLPEPVLPDWNIHLRGKYLIGGLLEDLYWRGYNYGISFQWKRHLIGIDGAVYRQTNERDNDFDEAQYREINRRTSIYLDYSFRLFYNDYTEYYIQVYSRVHGNTWFWRERISEDYSPSNPKYFEERARGHFTDFGGGLGVRFHPKPHFGIDVNLNMAYRSWINESIRFDEDMWITNEAKVKNWIPMFRATLYFSLNHTF